MVVTGVLCVQTLTGCTLTWYLGRFCTNSSQSLSALAELVAKSQNHHLKLVVFQAIRGDGSEQEAVSGHPPFGALSKLRWGSCYFILFCTVQRGDLHEWSTGRGDLCWLPEILLCDFLLSRVGRETFNRNSSHLKVMSSLNLSSRLNLLGGI